MTEDDICGSTDTHDSEPCQRTAGWGRDADSGPCVDHADAAGGTGRVCELKRNESIIDLVAGELQNGATVPEACAEARISEDQYYDWRRRAQADDSDEVFSKFYKETERARRVDSKSKRERLWEEAVKQGDLRTAYKLYHDQHGDAFGEESSGEDDAEGIPLVVPDSARPQQN